MARVDLPFKKTYTTQEAAQLLGVCRRTVERMLTDGRLEGVDGYGGQRVKATSIWSGLRWPQRLRARGRERRPMDDGDF